MLKASATKGTIPTKPVSVVLMPITPKVTINITVLFRIAAFSFNATRYNSHSVIANTWNLFKSRIKYVTVFAPLIAGVLYMPLKGKINFHINNSLKSRRSFAKSTAS
jgi:hypothetical protein